MGDGTEPFAVEDADWQSYCQTAMSELHQDERAALLRVLT